MFSISGSQTEMLMSLQVAYGLICCRNIVCNLLVMTPHIHLYFTSSFPCFGKKKVPLISVSAGELCVDFGLSIFTKLSRSMWTVNKKKKKD